MHEILRSHDRVEPRHFVFFFFFFFSSFHDARAARFRVSRFFNPSPADLSNLSLSLSLLCLSLFLLLFLLPIHANGGGRGEGAKEGRRAERKRGVEGMHRSRTRSTATPRVVARMGRTRRRNAAWNARRGGRRCVVPWRVRDPFGYTKPLVVPPPPPGEGFLFNSLFPCPEIRN